MACVLSLLTDPPTALRPTRESTSPPHGESSPRTCDKLDLDLWWHAHRRKKFRFFFNFIFFNYRQCWSMHDELSSAWIWEIQMCNLLSRLPLRLRSVVGNPDIGWFWSWLTSNGVAAEATGGQHSSMLLISLFVVLSRSRQDSQLWTSLRAHTIVPTATVTCHMSC